MAWNFLLFAKLESFARNGHAGQPVIGCLSFLEAHNQTSVSEIDEAMSTIEEEDQNATQPKGRKKATNQPAVEANDALQPYILPILKPDGSIARWACDFSLEIVHLNLLHMFNAMMQNIVEKGHMPSAKFFLELAERAEEMQSEGKPETKKSVRKTVKESFSLLDLMQTTLDSHE